MTFFRALLNTTFLMGDGNFHMQLRSHAKPLTEDPCYFNNIGYFADQKLYRSYTQEAERLGNYYGKVLYDQVLFAIYNIESGAGSSMCVTGRYAITR